MDWKLNRNKVGLDFRESNDILRNEEHASCVFFHL